jgi:hypothetical protein
MDLRSIALQENEEREVCVVMGTKSFISVAANQQYLKPRNKREQH